MLRKYLPLGIVYAPMCLFLCLMKKTKIPKQTTAMKIGPTRRTALEEFICDYEPLFDEASKKDWRTKLSAVIEYEKAKVAKRINAN